MMGIDGGRRLFENEASKARNVSSTLRRFGDYFRHNWYGVIIAMVLVVIATWTQVASPDYIGQAVDCYLFPRAAQSFAGQEVAGSNCWFDPVVQTAVDGGQEALDAVSMDVKLAGLTSIVGILLGLFVVGSAMNGLAFFAMSRTGQSVLKEMRQDLFRKMQRLSMGYYAENEVGNVMSRITSDTDTIQQVFSFGLLSVIGGVLLIAWIMI